MIRAGAAFGTIVIDLNPNLIRIGPVLVTWHGIFSVIGIIAAARVGQILLARDGIRRERVYDMVVWMVVAGIVGARLLFVWENYQVFEGRWLNVLLLNEGGISQWGGIFGALAGAFIWCVRNGVDYRLVVDAAGPANAIGFGIGRIGDVINGEHHAITTNLPFGVTYVNPETLGEPGKVVHSEVAYEMIWDFLVFGVAMATYDRMTHRLPRGVTGLIWLSVYAFGRFWLSYLRVDSLAFGLRQAQWASLAMIGVSALAITVWMVRDRGTRRRGGRPDGEPAEEEAAGEVAPA